MALPCSRAEVKGALLACQAANFLHCYMHIVRDPKSNCLTLDQC